MKSIMTNDGESLVWDEGRKKFLLVQQDHFYAKGMLIMVVCVVSSRSHFGSMNE